MFDIDVNDNSSLSLFHLYTSMHPNDVQLKEGTAQGRMILKNYIENKICSLYNLNKFIYLNAQYQDKTRSERVL